MENNINDYLTNGELFSKLSDFTRIVDPLQKRVIEYGNKEVLINNIHCFDFWGKNKVCDNCISMRAYNDNTTYVKIEYRKDKTYIVTAVPYILDNRKVVVEILKDITNSLFFESLDDKGNELTGIHALIDSMNKLAFKDQLTGLYNRRYIMEKLPVDLLNAKLLSKEISIIIFKAVNDNYGHLTGDKVLIEVSEIIKRCVRISDIVGRYGGEEYLVILPDSKMEEACLVAERIRDRIQHNNFSDGVRITISGGLAVYKGESLDQFLNHADMLMYQAKKNGRNQIAS